MKLYFYIIFDIILINWKKSLSYPRKLKLNFHDILLSIFIYIKHDIFLCYILVYGIVFVNLWASKICLEISFLFKIVI